MTDTSRRDFLKSAGTYSAVAGVSLSGGISLGGPVAPLYAHPFGYPEAGLDVERTRELAYAGYKGITLADETRHGGCAFAGFNAIIGQLAEVVGEPYTTIPTQMMDWAGAGVVGFGSLCGTLNGVAAAIGLVCDGADAKGFVSDLMTWYSETPLPTNIISPTGDLTQSTATSNLCHISVSRWCMESGLASGSPERAERCARLAGDVAAKAVEMLNDGRMGLEVPGQKTPCRSCHYMGPDFDAGQFTHGDMNCMTCHIGHK
jgi:hypothetical protein